MDSLHIVRHVLRLGRKFGVFPFLARTLLGQQIASIALLTWKAAFRFRLFWVLAALLLLSVVALPLLLKDDGTARGFTQILLTYTLSVITALLGLSTLWLACGTLARDIEDCQMQMVAVKPVARWQIWLGKWFGILLLNAALLSLAGGGVFALLKYRAGQLPEAQQRILRNEIFVARASLTEPLPDIESAVEQEWRSKPELAKLPRNEQQMLREQIRQKLRAPHQIVLPNYLRRWEIPTGRLRSSILAGPIFLRVKFHAAVTNASGLYNCVWEFGPAESPHVLRYGASLPADTFSEIEIPKERVTANLLDPAGVLHIRCMNYDRSALLFPLEDGLEVLYREGGFGLNFARGLGIIFCWLALLAALGLASASLMSFPVASFFCLSLMIIVLSSGTLTTAVEEGAVFGSNHETGETSKSVLDLVLIPFFKSILGVVHLAGAFSPIDSLSTGRSITWGQLGLAFTQIVLLMGGVAAALGILFFHRRELATAQGKT